MIADHKLKEKYRNRMKEATMLLMWLPCKIVNYCQHPLLAYVTCKYANVGDCVHFFFPKDMCKIWTRTE